MLRFILRFFGFLFSWLAIGSIMALGVLAGVFYIYGRDLPDHAQLARYEPATLSRIYSGEGRLMDEFARERRIFTPIDEIPDRIKQAFISAEDKNFYHHHGFDPVGIAAAIWQASQGDRLRGASTITQQVMKNFLLTGDRSGERKIKEIILATRLENTLTKDKILELYLNEIFLGQNSYGVTAAAQVYFAKSLEELTLAEMAYLAALPKEPSNLHPVRQKERAIARRDYVIDQMADNGYVTRDEADAAKAEDLVTVQGGAIASARRALPPRDYFTDEIRRQLSASLGDEELFTGGLTIRATVDPDLQAVAAKALRDGLEKFDRDRRVYRGPAGKVAPEGFDPTDEASWRRSLSETQVPRDIEGWSPAVVLSIGESSVRIGIEDVPEDEDGHFLPFADVKWARLRDGVRFRESRGPDDTFDVGDVILVKEIEDGDGKRWSYRQVPEIQGGFMAMDTRTGRVLAMQGGFSYQSSVFNRATQALRQPGSSFKPFVYAAALDNGFSPATIVVDAPIEVLSGGEIWRPQNSNEKFYGPTPMRTGLEQSRNLMTVRIAQQVGMDVVAEYAERFGVYHDMPQLLSYSLGAGETTLFDMVAAYAMFANGGLRVEPTLVDRVQDRYGRTIYRHDTRPCEDCAAPDISAATQPIVRANAERIMDPITAFQITSMLQGAVARGTGANTVGKLNLNLAGKTGTTNDAKDVWFIGYSPRIAAGCFMGYDNPRSLGDSAFGGTLCAPIFKEFIETAMAGQGPVKWDAPPGGYWIKVDRRSGQRLSDDASGAGVQAEYVRDGQERVAVGAYAQTVDGGWRMGEDVPLFAEGESAATEIERVQVRGATRALPKNPKRGALSSGGLY
ncbi:penicillin-binding protein 1A [Amaricoccus sp.]|uniref:penicillin-binding protein 1A n=1 Tax=Amaricoccus sp. TaxID=1872485 RepID=UPI001B6322EA|nr:penicillin-binding protein 1A [Amaricoccus sp.]MBP7001477.1 penicillin-binding protein 1A [Amaricoccus sp.]